MLRKRAVRTAIVTTFKLPRYSSICLLMYSHSFAIFTIFGKIPTLVLSLTSFFPQSTEIRLLILIFSVFHSPQQYFYSYLIALFFTIYNNKSIADTFPFILQFASSHFSINSAISGEINCGPRKSESPSPCGVIASICPAFAI